MSSVIFILFSLSINAVVSKKFLATMPGAYPKKADDYICTQIPLPDFKQEAGYVTAFKAVVNESVHHIILSACDKWITGHKSTRPGPCLDQCRTHILYAWAHSGAPFQLPEGSAFEIGFNTPIKSLSMEVHYSRREAKPDYATIELTYTREPQPNLAGVILMYSAEATIPPHSQHFATNISCRLRTEVPIHVVGIRTHAHDLNKGVYGYYRRPGDPKYHLLARGNANWPQTFYKPSQLSADSDAIRLNDKDILMARCVYDSTDRDRPTAIGSTHADEMCNLYLMYILDAHYELPTDFELCADEMVPGAWDHPPPGSLDYVSGAPPPKLEDIPQSSAYSIDFLPDPSWHIRGAKLGKVSGIALTTESDGKTHLFVLRRGENPWDENSFSRDYKYLESDSDFVPSPVFHVDAESGKIIETFGDDRLVLPHGLAIAHGAGGEPLALWLTDLALHQVMQFDWGKWDKPSMILGSRAKPGHGKNTFCQPTDVAVASSGEIFVADGYCNHRIVKFSPQGDYLTEWGIRGTDSESKVGFFIPHNLAIIPGSKKGDEEQICVADRERGQIWCYNLEGHIVARYSGKVLQPSVFAIDFSPVYGLIFGVTGPGSALESVQAIFERDLDEREFDMMEDVGNKAFAFQPFFSANSSNDSRGLHLQINSSNNQLDLELQSPHDIEISPDGKSLFVAQLKAPYLSKIDIVKSGGLLTNATSTVTTIHTKKKAILILPSRSLSQKVFITGIFVALCVVVVLIALILFLSRRQRPWVRWNQKFAYNPSLSRMATRLSKRSRYDGFRPLHQDELQSLGSAFENEEEDDNGETASDTIIDVRKMSFPGSHSNLSPHSEPQKTYYSMPPNQHINT